MNGKIAVVTGASRGLGRRVAIELAAHGVRVALMARGAEQLAAAVKEISQAGGDAAAFPADMTDPKSVDAAAKAIASRLGPPTILVNAAGVFGPIQRIDESDPARWIETLMVNTVGPYLTCRAFTAGMVAAKWGRIVNFTSAAALHPPGPLNSAYGTSKVALNQMTRHLAAELKGTGVTANVIHPGDVRTDMWAAIRDEAEALGPAAEGYLQWVRWVDQTGGDDPAKAARLVLRIVGDEAAATTGQFLWIENPLQAPIPSWESADGQQPWKK
ncbi:MAG: SDR family NAD(P)-dependent oxidoreductase [Planctomycetota bacterium]|nr:SDR family NAD(P)-dependent oxidoreductase [Planctomycetota bacterium]